MPTGRLKVIVLSAVFVTTMSFLNVARAATFGFDAITSNDVADIPVYLTLFFLIIWALYEQLKYRFARKQYMLEQTPILFQ